MLTKKQKEEQRAAELRKQALLASGVQIEGLQHQNGGQLGKKVVYGNRKKKAPINSTASGPSTRDPSPVRESLPDTEPNLETKAQEPTKNGDDVKDDWDADSGDEANAEADVKEAWDDSSDDEAKKPAAAGMFTVTTCLYVY